MALVYDLPCPQSIQNPAVSIANGDASALKTLCTAGALGTLVKSINITSTDTSSRVVQLWHNDGSTDRLLGSVVVPAGAGTDGVNFSVDLINVTTLPGLNVDNNGKRFFQLQATRVLKVKTTTTVTAAKSVDIVGCGEDY